MRAVEAAARGEVWVSRPLMLTCWMGLSESLQQAFKKSFLCFLVSRGIDGSSLYRTMTASCGLTLGFVHKNSQPTKKHFSLTSGWKSSNKLAGSWETLRTVMYFFTSENLKHFCPYRNGHFVFLSGLCKNKNSQVDVDVFHLVNWTFQIKGNDYSLMKKMRKKLKQTVDISSDVLFSS